MRKFTMLVALVLISAFSFAQQKQKNSEFKAVKVLKSINNMAPGAKSVVDSLRYDGDNADGVGTNTTASTFGVYAFFPTAYTSAHQANGNTITSVKLYINGVSNVTSSTIKIFSDQGVTSLASQVFTAVEGWNEVTLTTPLAIPATDMYIGYEIVTTGGFPAGCDGATTPNPNGNWIDLNGAWQHANELSASLTANWNIRAMVSGTALTTPVAICNPLAWDASSVIVGNSATSATFTLQNVGAGTLTVSGITGLSAPYTTNLVPASVNLTGGQTTEFTFTYAPTVTGAANQTVVIATNAGNITIELTGNGIECSTISTYPWNEGFEGGVEIPACWTLTDADGDGYNWFVGSVPNTSSHSGDNSISSASYSGVALTPDNYLITPKFNINSNNLSLTFWAAAQDPDWVAEHYSVMVSTTGTAPANFTEVFNETLADTAWHQINVPLTSYNGQEIYIAFRHFNSTDMFRMKLDDIYVGVTTGVAENTQDVISVFPNPANDKLFISSSKINTVEIYNLTGAKVASFGNQNVISISDLAQGTYLVKVITDNKVTTQKINIVR